MCNHYSNRTDAELTAEYRKRLRISEQQQRTKEFAARYSFYYANGFVHPQLPVVTMQNPTETQFYSWGLIPHWVKDNAQAQQLRKGTLNATCEGVFDKPSFRYSIQTQRCLVPATGFFEWHTMLGGKYPYHIVVKHYDFPDDERPFFFGGLYSQWIDKTTGQAHNTFTIVTTPANQKMEFIHNSKKRMPLILHTDDEDKWLNPSLSPAQLKAIMQPYPDKYLRAFSISKHLTGPGNRNSIETLEPYPYDNLPDVIN